jgi:excisionase family DNA binding protein
MSGGIGKLAFTPAEVAEALSLGEGEAGERRVRRMIERGELGAFKAGKGWRIPEHELQRLLNSATPSAVAS